MSTDNDFPGWHGTTIVAVRKGNKVVIAGDGQVSVGNTVMKHNAKKVRRLAGGKVIGGFAGARYSHFRNPLPPGFHAGSPCKEPSMSSRAGTETARLRRLRRAAARQGLAILAAGKPASKGLGGYMLSNDETRKVVLGGEPKPYAATLDEIEAWLESEGGE
jgi:ATP-dependent HslUV protease subunit HslV